MEGTIGEVRMFGGNFAPRNWALCQGQLLAITNYQALFSILGTMYGGDGRTTFGLPDMRGRSAVGVGQGPGLSNAKEGQKMGSENVTLTENQLAAHSHVAQTAVNASTASASAGKPTGNTWASPGTPMVFGPSTTPPAALAADAVVTSIANTGANAPVPMRSPQLCVNFIICLEGVYPSRS